MKYINEPRVRPLSDYTIAQQLFLEHCATYPDILAVYTAGTVSQPGISDLDFYLCLRDQLTQPLDIETTLPESIKELIGSGTILKCNAENFSNIHIIDQVPLQRLAGQSYEIREYDSEWFMICRIMDWLPERLDTLRKVKAADQIDVTRTLQILKSLTVTVNLLEHLSPDARAMAWVAELKKLRANWFDNKQALTDFEVVLTDGLLIAQQALNRMDAYIRQRQYIAISLLDQPVPAVMRIPYGPQFDFHSIPPSFYYFLAAQAVVCDTWLTQQLRHSFDPEISSSDWLRDMHSEWVAVIKQRIEYVSDVADYFRRNSLKSGLLKYGWYLK